MLGTEVYFYVHALGAGKMSCLQHAHTCCAAEAVSLVTTTVLVTELQTIIWPMDHIRISICILWLIFVIYSPRATVAFNVVNGIECPMSVITE